MTERQGVEVDYCPNCRGVWLDKGELDKILERASTEFTGSGRERDDDRSQRDDNRGGRTPPKRKRSFLSEIFESGD